MERRVFLKKYLKVSVFFLLTLFSAIASLFIFPSVKREKKTLFFKVFSEYNLPKRGLKRVDIKIENNVRHYSMAVFIVNHDNEIFALSPVCTHLGCLVNWSRHKNLFICPCHGGVYDIKGFIKEGPPRKPLSRLPLKTDNGEVYIGLKV